MQSYKLLIPDFVMEVRMVPGAYFSACLHLHIMSRYVFIVTARETFQKLGTQSTLPIWGGG